MTQSDIEEFARLLESAGYGGAMALIMEDLLPIARKHQISLYAAAERYADCDQEQDTSFYQLGMTLMKIPKEDLKRIHVLEPVGKFYGKKFRRKLRR